MTFSFFASIVLEGRSLALLIDGENLAFVTPTMTLFVYLNSASTSLSLDKYADFVLKVKNCVGRQLRKVFRNASLSQEWSPAQNPDLKGF